MSDHHIVERIDLIERKLDLLDPKAHRAAFRESWATSDEIDLRELIGVVWDGRWWIISSIIFFAVLSIFYVRSLPRMYKAEGVYAPAQQRGASGLASQYGGLAAMAGIRLAGGESNDIDQAVLLIKSWSFLGELLDRHELKPLIMGVKDWNLVSREIEWDEDIFSPEKKVWVRKSWFGRDGEPTNYEAYNAFSKMISVANDPKTGLITVTVEYYSPDLAANWVGLLVQELSVHFQQRDLTEARENINYLKQKIGETGVAEMQSVFYRMIEDQTKKLMLAEVGNEYLLKVVIPPKVPESASKPRRVLIVLLGLGMGFIFGLLAVIVRFFLKGSN